MSVPSRAMKLDRRRFLGASGAIVVSFAVGIDASPVYGSKPGPAPRALLPTELDSYIAIDATGGCTAFFGKTDVGQGLQVAIAQMVAEELDLPLSDVRVVMGDTAQTIDQGGASGSYGVSRGGKALRFAAAEARRILMERAAERLGIPAAEVTMEAGVARGRTGGPGLGYGELVGETLFEAALEWNGTYGNRLEVHGLAAPKDPADYRIVGTSPPREDVADNVYGLQKSIAAIRLPDMLHARVIRPPRTGARPVSVAADSIARFGAKIVHENALLAVLAEREWDAIRAADALDVGWGDEGPVFPEQERLYEYLRDAPASEVQVEVDEGASDVERAGSDREIEAVYEWPFQSHASMAGACAVADVRDGSATVWSATQKPHGARAGIAALLGIPVDGVRVIWTRGPGSYGRNDAGDAALEAAFLSHRTGRPVRLQYSRAQATGWDPKGPASIHLCRGVLSESGQVLRYGFTSRGFSRMEVAPAEADPRDTLPGQLLGLEPNPRPAFAVPKEPYAVPARRLAWEIVPGFAPSASPLRAGHLRDPVGLQINFASESFWDEMAHAAGIDPVDFRLRHLENPRARAVLRAAADRFDWSAPLDGRSGGEVLRGKGIALADRGDTVCALAVEIEVERTSGRIRPVRFVIAHDCGLIINPETLRCVLEGNIVQATSRSLLEEVTFDRYGVTSRDWQSYPVADVTHLPDRIDIELLDRPDLPPGGAGEPAGRPIPAALANALFDATGVRMRRAPLTAKRVAAALA